MQLINNQNCTFISVNHSVKPFSDKGFQVEMLLLQNIACTLGCFYIPNPLLGSSFWVLLTLSFFFEFLEFHLEPFKKWHPVNVHGARHYDIYTCRLMRTYV